MPDINSEYRKRFLMRQLMFESRYQDIFDKVIKQFADLSNNPHAKFTKAFRFPPAIRRNIEGIITDFHGELLAVTEDEIIRSWDLSNEKNDKIVANYLRTISEIKAAQSAAYYLPNLPALKAFISGKHGTETLSDSVWKIARQLRAEMSIHLGLGILNGDSASTISRRIRTYLQNPDALFRRVRDANGKLVPSKRMQKYHPGQGVYKSAYKNAMRMARSETNMAYHTSDNLRWQNIDFVKGIRIALSGSHPQYNYPEICEICAGDYPKTFEWTSWHPHCYSDDTEVLTVNGWKLFKDVLLGEEVLSLNKETKEIEITKVVDSTAYYHNGNMVHFHNRSLDMLVTEDHSMLYMSKFSPNKFKELPASEYIYNKGGLYRSSEWVGAEIEFMKIGTHQINFDLFCEFMGYYLADGSVSYTKKSEFNLSQRFDHDIKNRENIKKCLQKLPISFWEGKAGFGSTDHDFRVYLEQFGKALHKFIPDEIKKSSARQIKIFLDAFITCDGMIRKPHAFVGNRGAKFIAKSDEKVYTTSSTKMASDLGELILKIGKRPSYWVSKQRDVKFNNGTYNVKPNWKISECVGKTASVFKKEIVKYQGWVYDIEVKENHTLFVRRNGKCVWGTNCLCHATPIMTSRESFRNYLKTGRKEVNNFIVQYPDAFKYFVKDNFERFSNYSSVPYWFRDNLKVVTNIYNEMQ